ncbi:MAG: DNA mismatch repair protein MutS [Gammaproteobacteria bacterium]|nr:MAG: DNA mismatch repair protein MutS [Gammaproteobacteria bacterium]
MSQKFADLINTAKIVPLKKQNKISHTKKPATKTPQHNQKSVTATNFNYFVDTDSLSQVDTDSDYKQDGLQNKTFKKLKQGKIPAEVELDLHGQTANEAYQSLAVFLNQASEHHIKTIRIIHGKGFGSHKNKPVLKPLVRQYLQRYDNVLSYCSAPINQGGSGATLVLLKS